MRKTRHARRTAVAPPPPPPAPVVTTATLPLDAIDPSPTNRHVADDPDLPDLAQSIKEQGLLQPIGVRLLETGRYQIIFGERRWRAAALAGLIAIPVSIHALTDLQAREAQLVENLQHKKLHPLDEADAYQALLDLDPAYTKEAVASRIGKSTSHVYQRLTYHRLVPDVRDAFRAGTITPAHADRLARVPAAQQPEGLRRCFYPLLGTTDDRAPDALSLAPLRDLDRWIDSTVRLDVRDEDAKIFLPDLAEQVAEAEAKEGASILALSSHTFHVKTDDSSESKPILALSWKKAEGAHRCKHAQLGVIVLGSGRGSTLHVCIAKRTCHKHWPQSKRTDQSPRRRIDPEAEARANKARQDKEDRERIWRKEHYVPGVIRAIAENAKREKFTLDLLLQLLGVDQEARQTLQRYVGPLERVTTQRFAQVALVSLALARRQDWQDEALTKFAKHCRVNVARLRRTLLKSHPPDKIVLPAVAA